MILMKIKSSKFMLWGVSRISKHLLHHGKCLNFNIKGTHINSVHTFVYIYMYNAIHVHIDISTHTYPYKFTRRLLPTYIKRFFLITFTDGLWFFSINITCNVGKYFLICVWNIFWFSHFYNINKSIFQKFWNNDSISIFFNVYYFYLKLNTYV